MLIWHYIRFAGSLNYYLIDSSGSTLEIEINFNAQTEGLFPLMNKFFCRKYFITLPPSINLMYKIL